MLLALSMGILPSVIPGNPPSENVCVCCRDTPDHLHKTPASILSPKAASRIWTKSFPYFKLLPHQQLWMRFVLNKGCPSLVYFNHHEEVLLLKYQQSPLLSHQHFSPCLWGTLSKWAKQALVCPLAMCWQADSHLTRENWSSVAAELFPPGRLELHLSLLLSVETGLNGSCSKLVRQRNRTCSNFLYHSRQCDFLSKVCSGSETLEKLKDWPSLKKISCLTLDNYWITNEEKEPNSLIFWCFCHRIHTSTTYVSLSIAV